VTITTSPPLAQNSPSSVASTSPASAAPERRRISGWLGLLALLALMLAWKGYSLATSNFRVQETWSAADYLATFPQDLLAWCALFAVWDVWLRKHGRVAFAATIALACGLLVLQMIDERMKVRFLHPLSSAWIRFAITEFDTIGPDYAMFTGRSYWLGALASLAALLAMFAAPWIPGTARVSGGLDRAWSRWRLTLVPEIALAPLAVAVFVLPAKPYGLQQNFLVDLLLPLRTRHAGLRGHALMPSEQPVRLSSAADFGCTLRPSVAVAKGRNVVLYIIESTAFEQTSFGAAHDDTTPLLREMCEQGGVCVPCYAQIANSAKATFGLLSGLYASQTMEVLECEIARAPGLPRVLAQRGYSTVAVTPQHLYYQGQRTMFSRLGLAEILTFFDLQRLARERGREIDANSPEADDDRLMLEWDPAQLAARQPFFVVYYTQSAHFAYHYVGWSPGSDEERHRRALIHTDQVLREIVAEHKRLGVYDHTLYVILADHGEDFSDGRFLARNSSLTENGHKVALVLFAPGADLRGARLPTARQIDVAPTVLDLLGLPLDGLPLQGRSLFDGRGPQPIFLNSYGTERTLGLIDGTRKWAYDLESDTLRTVDLAVDPTGRALEPADATQHADVVRRMREVADYNEANLRDMASAP
jgi:arylsulfatase A-like enzyme